MPKSHVTLPKAPALTQRAVWSNEQTDLNALVMGDFILPIDYLIESLYSTEGLAALTILLG